MHVRCEWDAARALGLTCSAHRNAGNRAPVTAPSQDAEASGPGPHRARRAAGDRGLEIAPGKDVEQNPELDVVGNAYNTGARAAASASAAARPALAQALHPARPACMPPSYTQACRPGHGLGSRVVLDVQSSGRHRKAWASSIVCRSCSESCTLNPVPCCSAGGQAVDAGRPAAGLHHCEHRCACPWQPRQPALMHLVARPPRMPCAELLTWCTALYHTLPASTR